MSWKKSKGTYVNGEDYYLGRFKVGGWHYDGLRDKDATDRHLVSCSLPGLRKTLGWHRSPEDARKFLEKAVKAWIEGAGLSMSDVVIQGNEDGE